MTEDLRKAVAEIVARSPDEVQGNGLYALLVRMGARHLRGETPFCQDDEYAKLISPEVLKPIVCRLSDELQAWLGKGGNREPHDIRKSTAEDSNLSDSDRFLIGQTQQPAALQDGLSMLNGWFFESGTTGPIWAKALRCVQREPRETRDKKAAGFLITAGIRWLKGEIHQENAEAFLDESVRDALSRAKDIFEPLDEEATAYGLRGRGHSTKPELDVRAFARKLGRREFRLRDEVNGSTAALPDAAHRLPSLEKAKIPRRDRIALRIPYPSDIRDLLKDAMEKAGFGFTIGQAKIIVRAVFSIPVSGPPLSLQENREVKGGPETTAQSKEEEGNDQTGNEESNQSFLEEPTEAAPDITDAVEAVLKELQARDGISPNERPSDSAKGREARYLLDFEIWRGWPLLPGPLTEKLRDDIRRRAKKELLDHYTQACFEVWSGIPDSSVSTWRGPRRTKLLAKGAVEFYPGWTEDHAQVEIAIKSRRAEHFIERLFWELRKRFLHRKPEFVDAAPLEHL